MLQRHAIILFIVLSLAVHGMMAWFLSAHQPDRQVISARTISLMVSQRSPEPSTTHLVSKTAKAKESAPTEVISYQEPSHHKQPIKPAAIRESEPAPTESPRVAQSPVAPPSQASTNLSAHSIPRDKVKQHVQLALIKQLQYPGIARRRGWEGIVVVAVHLDAQGRLSNFNLIKTSGYPLLDESATRSLQRLASVPEVINWLNGRGLDIELPVEYRLIDS